MSVTLPLFPIWAVDVAGSGLMILFSFLCVHLARSLKQQDRNNVIWTYLLWLSYSLAAFAVSRSVGHIAKRILLNFGYDSLWEVLKPYSGAINSITFVVVASITLFFERTWRIYELVVKDGQTLQEAHEKILFMNRNLEDLVEERTRELARSEIRYREIFQSSRDMIVVTRGDGTIVELNPAGEALLGASHDAVVGGGASLTQWLHGEKDWEMLDALMRQQGHVSNQELDLRRPDGSVRRVLVSGSLREASGEDSGILHFMVKDISQRKAMERQLLQADKLASVGHLAAGVAHEVNNPLGVILGYTQLLLRGEEEGTQRYGDLKIIEKHARTCKSIVGDLLSFSRSTQTHKGLSHVHKPLEEVLGVVKHHFDMDRVVIERDLDPAMPSMTLDEEKMRQVFMNLIMNAKQAIGKDGTMRVKTELDASARQAVIHVQDTGCGIRPRDLGSIFDPFFTTKSTGEGTGLGLSVSYGIVKDHGGEILVESTEGQGATFTVVLPLQEDREGQSGGR